MKSITSEARSVALLLLVLIAMWDYSGIRLIPYHIIEFQLECYDPLDPNGNMTVTFDILRWTDDGYVARVTIQNYHQYRHVGNPGWRLGWSWTNDEVIWSMSGALATHQGNCSAFKSQIPHCCKKTPEITDQTPNAILAAFAINPLKSFSSFEIVVGNLQGDSVVEKPQNLTLMAPGPGYTCGPFEDTDPTVSSDVGGRREEQVFRTWKSTCTFSSFLANKTPICCVSLSTFYSRTITSCPLCSCGCRVADKSTKSCIREGSSTASLVDDPDIVHCTDHMCPLQIHCHIKQNFRDHWRVKLTISNHNYVKNYSNWNVLVQHPGFSKPAISYSFNSTKLPSIGMTDDVALFWGIDYYNDELLQAEYMQVGSVTTEILLSKDSESFTLSNGWAFPRRIYFNGDNCQMPLPDTFPSLPNGNLRRTPSKRMMLLLVLLYILLYSSFDKYLLLPKA